jgi:hypothetical protein
MRGLAVLALLAAVLGACSTGAAGNGKATFLTVTYWPEGRSEPGRTTWTLGCKPARGSLPRPAVACRRLAAGGPALLAPVAQGLVCTQIYGGPQVARVTGTVAGQRVRATFSRTDGCQIARWAKLSPWLLPPGGVTG